MIVMLLIAQIISIVILRYGFGLQLFQITSLLTSQAPYASLALKTLQITQGICMFIVSALIFSFLMSGNDFLYTRTSISPGLILLVLLLVMVAEPLITTLGIFNSRMSLPPFFGDLEKMMKDSEETLSRLTYRLLEVRNPTDLVINLFMIAIIPAVGEEFIFRGCLQQILVKSIRNHHVAILLTAAIFSAIHFQFYGFLPRFFLGLILGYLFYWSSSIWLSVSAHFFNNALAVMSTAFSSHKNQRVVPQQDKMPDQWLILVSVILIAGLLYGIHKLIKLKSEIRVDRI